MAENVILMMTPANTPDLRADGAHGESEPAAGMLEPIKPSVPDLLGEKLISLGLITRAHLDHALVLQQRAPHKRLGMLLVEQGMVSESALWGLLGERPSATSQSIEGEDVVELIDGACVHLVPRDLALAHKFLPLSSAAGAVVLATGGPCDMSGLSEVRGYFPAEARIVPRYWPALELIRTIEALHARPLDLGDILAELQNEADPALFEVADEDWTNPLVRLANALMIEAIARNATTLHIAPEGHALRLSYRVDGLIESAGHLAKPAWPPLMRRFRRLAGLVRKPGMPVAPDRGELRLRLGDRSFIARLAFCETRLGESLVIDIRETLRRPISLERIGLSDRNLVLLHKALVRPAGAILIASPAGSGRTTTLYALARRLANGQRSLAAIEETHEFTLPGLRQLADPDSLSATVQSNLRDLDADALLIDVPLATADLDAVLRLAQSRRVIAVVEGSDVLSMISTALAQGLSPALLAANLAAVASQRVLRKLCPVCKVTRPLTPDEARVLNLKPAAGQTTAQPAGCPSCKGTGYRGRVVLAEVLALDERLMELIEARAPRDALRAAAIRRGYRSLFEDGVQKVLAGEVSLNELARTIDLTAHF